MTALYLILHACLAIGSDGTCEQPILVNDSLYAIPAHVCTIKVTRTRRDFLAHLDAGYHMATETWDGRPAFVRGASCAPTPVCECEVTP